MKPFPNDEDGLFAMGYSMSYSDEKNYGLSNFIGSKNVNFVFVFFVF